MISAVKIAKKKFVVSEKNFLDRDAIQFELKKSAGSEIISAALKPKNIYSQDLAEIAQPTASRHLRLEFVLPSERANSA